MYTFCLLAHFSNFVLNLTISFKYFRFSQFIGVVSKFSYLFLYFEICRFNLNHIIFHSVLYCTDFVSIFSHFFIYSPIHSFCLKLHVPPSFHQILVRNSHSLLALYRFYFNSSLYHHLFYCFSRFTQSNNHRCRLPPKKFLRIQESC